MPTRITIECTHCGAKLNLADESKLGKKMKCPKCSEVFVAASGEDDDFDEPDEEEAEERPRGKKGAAPAAGKKGAAAKGGKKGKGKPAKSGSNLGLILGGVAGVVVLLGGLVGVLFATGVFGGSKPDPNQIQVSPQPGPGVFGSLLKEQPKPASSAFIKPAPLDQKWLPADTEILARIRMADVWETPLVKKLAAGPQADQFIAEMKKRTGLEPSQIESVSVIFHGVQNLVLKSKLAMDPNDPSPPNLTPPMLILVQTKQPVSGDALFAALGGTKQTHQDKTYWELPQQPGVAQTMAAYLAEPQTLIIGETAGIQQAITRGPASQRRPSLEFLDANQQLLFAAIPTPIDPQDLEKANKIGIEHPGIVSLSREYVDQIHGASFGLRLSNSLQAVATLSCKSPQSLQQMKALIESSVNQAVTDYQAMKKEVPPFFAEVLDDLIGQNKLASDGQMFQVQAGIGEASLAKLTDPAMMFMAMAAAKDFVPPSNVLPGPLSGLFGKPSAPPAIVPSPGGNSTTTDEPARERPDTEPTIAKAKSAAALPKGFELNGTLSEGYHTAAASQRPLGFALELNFTGKGECLIAAVGKLQAGEGSTEDGVKISFAVPTSVLPDKESSGWELLFNDSAESGLVSATVGNYELAVAENAAPFQSISGSFSFLTGKKSKLIQIKNAKALAGKEPTDPALKAAGLTIQFGKLNDSFGETEILTVSVKPGYLLTKVQAIDAGGKQSYDAFTGISPNEQTQILKPGVGSLELKEGLGFQAYLYSDLKEVEVPFTFENVELPKTVEK